MRTSDDPRRVHFQSPAYLVERLDTIADILDTDRTELVVDAIREYIDETADSESFQNQVATKYHDDQLVFETVKQLVGPETAQRLRPLKADLEASRTFLNRQRDDAVRPMARPVRLQWDDHVWSESPRAHRPDALHTHQRTTLAVGMVPSGSQPAGSPV